LAAVQVHEQQIVGHLLAHAAFRKRGYFEQEQIVLGFVL